MKDWPSYYRYWGKARTKLEIDYCTSDDVDADIAEKHALSVEELHRRVRKHGWQKIADGDKYSTYHLLPYHCLDVAAVAHVWWQQSKIIHNHFIAVTGQSEAKTYAWVMFFIAMHDLGKFDVRFQLKVKEIAIGLWNEFRNADPTQAHKYWHGDYSSYWVFRDLHPRFHWDDDFGDDERWNTWQQWIFAVAGHHGVIPNYVNGSAPPADRHVIEHDKAARLSFIAELAIIFLKPADLSLNDIPPCCDQDFFAGFCSVCDWLGSSQMNADGVERFDYENRYFTLKEYFISRIPIAEQILLESGLYQPPGKTGGMAKLFPKYIPRLVQTLVDKLPVRSGLTIIEAPTGSGKTEAALAYASHLLATGMVESIIFALPTQATANAMFDRLLEVTEIIYSTSNLLLAHGKARFYDKFIDLKKAVGKRSPQDAKHEMEATIQCSQWLAQSRKRVFLGQVGVCTVDQVLISVLPVKHKFVRSFGLGKSVLIIDEVHAYDSYMYGLLQGVLKKQCQMNGAAILLSATLPSKLKDSLVEAWGEEDIIAERTAPYPLITHVSNSSLDLYCLPDSEQQELESFGRQVSISIIEQALMRFDDNSLKQVIIAAFTGANVVLICNLVADAQATARRLIELGATSIELFHSRYRFKDRQGKEKGVICAYGPGEKHRHGGILVATQVVEQSLDIDFDWMLTQLCPIDALFQRLGRLHRHDRKRPNGFEKPLCTVIIPLNHDYELHKLIYGNKDAPNSRVLWRTEQLLCQHTILKFPGDYRPMIEEVYKEKPWDNEPEKINEEYMRFELGQEATKSVAWQLMQSKPNFEDSDSKAALLTRDGEMNLNVIPVVGSRRRQTLLDGKPLAEIEEWELAEELSINSIPVPASWKRILPAEKEGIIWLAMEQTGTGIWQAESNRTTFKYTFTNGLERKDK